MSRAPSAAFRLAVGGVVIVVLGFIGLLLGGQRRVEGPVPIVWDKEACAFCHMHIGEPAFAAQAQLGDGAVLNFDDPGCLLSWTQKHQEPPSAVYVRHYQEERWLTKSEASFVTGLTTPMGFGLGAVPSGRPATLSWDQASAWVAKTRGERAVP